jgi:hypothetical protein
MKYASTFVIYGQKPVFNKGEAYHRVLFNLTAIVQTVHGIKNYSSDSSLMP